MTSPDEMSEQVAAELLRTGDALPLDPAPRLARRGVLLGGGVATLAVGTLGGSRSAAADPPPSPESAVRRAGRMPTQTSPVAATAASAPISGCVYRHVGWMDFSPESGAVRQWSSNGAYASAATTLWATVEVPAGALVREIEWYAYNNTGTTKTALGRWWAAGTSTLFPTVADVSIPSSPAPSARRIFVPQASYGPYPIGTKLALGLEVTATGTVAVGGARVGISQGAGAVGLLPTPVRAYDSRFTGGKLTPGSTRTVTLPASLVPPGTNGVVVNVTATGAAGTGYLTVYPGNAAKPPTSSINYAAGDSVANAIVIGVSAARQLKVYSSNAAHVILDVSGTIG